MIKEIFDIESKQKNVLIILIGIFGLSFMQLYLFKRSIFDIGIFFSIGVSIGLTVCWTILNIPSLLLFLFFAFDLDKKSEDEEDTLHYDKVVFGLGLFAIGWISLLTYISYELNFTFKNFIRLAVFTTILRIVFWILVGLTRDRKSKK